jgi:hypothetical protein
MTTKVFHETIRDRTGLHRRRRGGLLVGPDAVG